MVAIPWDDSETTLATIFADSGRYGDREAIVFVKRGGEARWTYREVFEHARGFAGELAAEGVGSADTVALSARNQPEWIVICLGIVLSGATVVPIDTQLDEEALRHVLLDCEAKRLVTASTDRERLQNVCADIGIDIILMDENGDEGDGARDRRGLHADGEYDFPSTRPDDTAVLFYTSGTTGPPKGVPLTHRNLVFQIRTIAGADLVRENDRILVPLPLHHVYPFVVGMLTPLALGLPLKDWAAIALGPAHDTGQDPDNK